jgi:beta-lactam-binding protein with PASTA domain
MDDFAAPQRPSRSTAAKMFDRDWVLAIALAFFVAVLVWFAHSVQDFFGGSSADILLPAFTGQTIDDANGECTRLQLTCTVVAHQPSEQFPRDVVMGQQPPAAARVRAGRAISLVVSTGINIFPMPDLRFESLRNVTLELGNVKLHLAGTKTVPNNDIPANHVVDQVPPPLSSVREGTDVTLTLSKGPPVSVKVPNFVAMNIDSARDAATNAKVHLGQIVWTPFGPNGPARGVVVRQSPAAGQSVDPFALTSLQVSAGPSEYGYIVRQVHVTAAIPVRDDTARVRMQVRDDTGTWNVYDGYAQGGAKLDLNVTAVGTAELDTYVNNELLDSTRIGVEPPKPSPSPQQQQPQYKPGGH